MSSLKYSYKTLKIINFLCSSGSCTKHLDKWNPNDYSRERGLKVPLCDNFSYQGCAQFKTRVYGLSHDSNVSQHEWDHAPLLAVILPNPDPTGAQAEIKNGEKIGRSGICDGIGFSRDLIFESLMSQQSVKKPLRVAFLFVTRGYNFRKISQGDLVNDATPEAAVGHCFPYLKKDLLELNPEKILLCGYESGELFFSGKFEVAEFRRRRGLKIAIGNKEFPVQVTHNPHFASINPPIIKCIQEDCGKIWGTQFELKPGKTRIIKTIDEAMEYLDFLSEHEGFIAVDTETQNLNRKAPNKLGTIQFATDEELGVVLPYQHPQSPFDPYELEILKVRLQELLANPIKAQGWIAHNAKFEHTIFKKHFDTFIKSAPVYDTQAMAYLLDETRSERKSDIPSGGGMYSLKQLARDLLGWEGYDKGVLKYRGDGALLDLDLQILADYAAMDAWVTIALFWRIQELAMEQDYLEPLMRMSRLFYSQATRLIAHIEMSGFKTNLKHVRNLAAKKGPFEKKLEKIEEAFKTFPAFVKANEIVSSEKNAGNIRSVLDDVPWVLDMSRTANRELVFFKIMGLPPVSWSDKTGRPSIDDEFFTAYSEDYPEIKIFSEYEEIKKMKNTFVIKTLERVDPESGDPDSKIDQRVRSDIHYSRLVTGRWAAVNPNTGQIPKSEEGEVGEEDIQVRKAVKDIFTVDPGCGLVQIDYKVNEVRWAGVLAQDEALARIFNEADKLMKEAQASENPELLKIAAFKEDVHRNTAAETFGVKIEEVSKEQRQASKCVHPETLVFSPDGVRRIGSLHKERSKDAEVSIENIELLTSDGYKSAPFFYSKGVENAVAVVTNKGVLICSKDHRIKLADGTFSFVDELKEDTLLYEEELPIIKGNPQTVPFNPFIKSRSIESPLMIPVTEDLAWILGVFVGDGSAPGRRIEIATGEGDKYEDWKDVLVNSLEHYGFKAIKHAKKIYFGSESEAKFLRAFDLISSKEEEDSIKELKKKLKIKKVLSPRKKLKIPDCIFNSPKSVRLSFLAGLIDTDGCISKRGATSILTKDIRLAQDICVLAQGLGLEFTLNPTFNTTYKKYYFNIFFRMEFGSIIAPYLRCPWKKERAKSIKPISNKKPINPLRVRYIEKERPELINVSLVDVSIDSKEHSYITNGIISHNCITFGILFQSSAKSIAENLNIEVEQAEAYIELFFSRMSGVAQWIDKMKKDASEKGYVEAPDGRRRRFWGFSLPPSCPNRRGHCSRNERQAVNSPIQGIASGAAMVGGVGSLLDYIENNNKSWLIQNVVHDSAIIQVPKDEIVDLISVAENLFVNQAQSKMEEMGVRFNLPLGIDVEVGVDWGSLTKWNGTKTHAQELQVKVIDYWKSR